MNHTIKPEDVRKTIDKHMLADGADVVVDLERSHGAYLVDQVTGREYIDFFTFFASAPVGHNHPKMHDSVFYRRVDSIFIEQALFF